MNNFIKDCLRTEAPISGDIQARMQARLRELHATMGMQTEVGEIVDQLKKHIFYGKELDIINIKEEIGDLLWYVSLLLDCVDGTYEECMTKVVAKLKARYPEKFTEDKAINRDLDKEREVLEGKYDDRDE